MVGRCRSSCLAELRPLKQHENFEVVPFDDHVLSRFEVDALFAVWPQRDSTPYSVSVVVSLITADYRQAADRRAVFKSAATR